MPKYLTAWSMDGLDNRFLVLDCRTQSHPFSPACVRSLAQTRVGAPADQVIVLEPHEEAALFMRIFNRDGSPAEACGNATRCVAALVMRETHTNTARIATPAGILACTRASPAPPKDDHTNHGFTDTISVAMGVPDFSWRAIPLSEEHPPAMPITSHLPSPLPPAYAVNIGNPHLVFFLPETSPTYAELGQTLEHHPLFSEGANVSFATLTPSPASSLTSHGIILHVWERGAGLTRACGTAACATAALAIRIHNAPRTNHIHLPGGTLTVRWHHPAHPIVLTGPCRSDAPYTLTL